ncbi:DNA-binding winged helix-turn-helix (wHTH) protein [Bradyrhizobium japonicum]|nr:DNA-binding winged helix-turn-helix (wHTH) protein [Bradyrhizobium japonicum]MCP1774470.1 DNA-binding winged helix-turn-helix (wHTH) protein [Bradyrhizobium japonicum]MCP1865913.1 DNA-binding winged helix-turn-helix (wHTH) protein [Bradyrhizobium japonicum]MCP1895319.1 DNA-binding winged helix-turn-helix (wHTH) protein [Bradyrhizobium japonicum]MCP1962528.1 DNA-binding winged helix-turn-helix (wHTH) protein [Bradyrhizobium japonicum]
MRFVPTKTVEQQSCLLLHRARHLFIRQQTAVINSIRAYLAEFGIVAPVGRRGVFALDAETGALLCRNAPTLLGRRGAALLRLLLERASSPVGKDTLIDAAWPGLNVEESNLTVQIAALRRALEQDGGGRRIETLPRRGYRYVGPPVTRIAMNGDEAGHEPAL